MELFGGIEFVGNLTPPTIDLLGTQTIFTTLKYHGKETVLVNASCIPFVEPFFLNISTFFCFSLEHYMDTSSDLFVILIGYNIR